MHFPKHLSQSFLLVGAGAIIAGASLVSAQTPEIASSLSQTKETFNKLLELKDDAKLSDEEKAAREITLKKEIIKKVLDISTKQLSEVKDVTNHPSLQGDDWKAIREAFARSTAEALTYYASTSQSTDSAKDLTALKTIAQELENRKTGGIDVLVAQLHSLKTASGLMDITKLAQERLDKVTADVNKIYNQKLAKDATLKDQLSKANSSVQEAVKLDLRALEIMKQTYPSLEKAPADFMKALKKEMLDAKKLKQTTGGKIADPTADDISDYATYLSLRSIDNIKSAYDTFLSMSSVVQQYLK